MTAAPVLELLLGCLPALGGGEGPGRRNQGPGSSVDPDPTAGWRAVAEAAAEGLAKLLLRGGRRARDGNPHSNPGGLEHAEAAGALAALLAAFHDPATEAAAAARQCLSVFFPAYAAGGVAGGRERRAVLASAALPAARMALAAGASPARSAAPRLLRYVLQLLQARSALAAPPIAQPCVLPEASSCTYARQRPGCCATCCICFATSRPWP